MISYCSDSGWTAWIPSPVPVVTPMSVALVHRFVELHRAALRWSAERFTYVGIDPPAFLAPPATDELQVRLRIRWLPTLVLMMVYV